jgi:hypothetical protein
VKNEFSRPLLKNRKQMVEKHKHVLDLLKTTNKYNDYLQLINKELIDSANLLLIKNSFSFNLDDFLVQAKSIWEPFDWYPLFEEVATMLHVSIKCSDSNNRDIDVGELPEKPTVSVVTKNIRGELPEYRKLC